METKYELLLAFLVYGLEVMSRRDAGLILFGGRETSQGRRVDLLLDRLRRENLVDRHGRGASAKFTITEVGQRRVNRLAPQDQWSRPWDGRWRVFTFDLPMVQNQYRLPLWRSLRKYRFGLLQRSVWVWPHPVDSILQEVVQAQGIPECFCGFEADRLFLCSNAELVKAAWDFKTIAKDQAMYLNHVSLQVPQVNRAKDLHSLGRFVRLERELFNKAFFLDPLLPFTLWPEGYQGPSIIEHQKQLHAAIRARIKKLSTDQ